MHIYVTLLNLICSVCPITSQRLRNLCTILIGNMFEVKVNKVETTLLLFTVIRYSYLFETVDTIVLVDAVVLKTMNQVKHTQTSEISIIPSYNCPIFRLLFTWTFHLQKSHNIYVFHSTVNNLSVFPSSLDSS